MEGLDLSSIVTAAIFGATIYFSTRDKRDNQHTKSVQIDTELRQRVVSLEEKMREQVGHGPSITRLEAMVQNMARDLHELRSFWMLNAQSPYLRPPVQRKSPFDFQGAREWIDPELGA